MYNVIVNRAYCENQNMMRYHVVPKDLPYQVPTSLEVGWTEAK